MLNKLHYRVERENSMSLLKLKLCRATSGVALVSQSTLNEVETPRREKAAGTICGCAGSAMPCWRDGKSFLRRQLRGHTEGTGTRRELRASASIASNDGPRLDITQIVRVTADHPLMVPLERQQRRAVSPNNDTSRPFGYSTKRDSRRIPRTAWRIENRHRQLGRIPGRINDCSPRRGWTIHSPTRIQHLPLAHFSPHPPTMSVVRCRVLDERKQRRQQCAEAATPRRKAAKMMDLQYFLEMVDQETSIRQQSAQISQLLEVTTHVAKLLLAGPWRRQGRASRV